MVDCPTMANKTLCEGAGVQRKMVTPFTSNVNDFLPLSRKMVSESLEEWALYPDIVLLDEVKYLVRRVAAKRLLNIDNLSRDDHQIIENTLRGVRAEMENPWPVMCEQFKKARDRYRLFSRDLIAKNTAPIIEALESSSKKANFFAEVIKNLTDYKPGQDAQIAISHPLVTSAVLTIATVDGVYTNLTSVLLELLSNSQVREKLQIECMNAIDTKDGISDGKLMNPREMPYLHNVYREALRYNSSLPYLARYTKKGINTAETNIPPHSNLLINLKAMHFDPKHWGEDADQFMPERFERPGIKDYKMGQVPYIPFSLGDRQCPGMKVGEALIKLFLTMFIMSYKIEAVPGQPAPRVDDISLAPDPGPGYKVIISSNEKPQNEIRRKYR